MVHSSTFLAKHKIEQQEMMRLDLKIFIYFDRDLIR